MSPTYHVIKHDERVALSAELNALTHYAKNTELQAVLDKWEPAIQRVVDDFAPIDKPWEPTDPADEDDGAR